MARVSVRFEWSPGKKKRKRWSAKSAKDEVGGLRAELTFVDTSEDPSNSTLLLPFVRDNPFNNLGIDPRWSELGVTRNELFIRERRKNKNQRTLFSIAVKDLD